MPKPNVTITNSAINSQLFSHPLISTRSTINTKFINACQLKAVWAIVALLVYYLQIPS